MFISIHDLYVTKVRLYEVDLYFIWRAKNYFELTLAMRPSMELFNRMMKSSISPSGKLLNLWQPQNNYAAHAWQHSKHVWLLCLLCC